VESGDKATKASEPQDSSVPRRRPHHDKELVVTNRTFVFKLQSIGNVSLPAGTLHDYITQFSASLCYIIIIIIHNL